MLLRAAGYEVLAMEFVPAEHTRKNTLIRAIRRGERDPSARAATKRCVMRPVASTSSSLGGRSVATIHEDFLGVGFTAAVLQLVTGRLYREAIYPRRGPAPPLRITTTERWRRFVTSCAGSARFPSRRPGRTASSRVSISCCSRFAGCHRAPSRRSGRWRRSWLFVITPSSSLSIGCVEAGLIVRDRNAKDRRAVRLCITERGECVLADLTQAHLDELRVLAPALVAAFIQRCLPTVVARQ